MGQNQGSGVNPLLPDWRRHPTSSNLYINKTTGDSAEQHIVMVKKSDEPALYKRMHQSHKFVAPILYYEPVEKRNTIQSEQRYRIYTQKLDALSTSKWASVQSALAILKGFRRLSMTYGFLRVTPGMIGVNSKKQIRVWINEHSAANYQQFTQTLEEATMVDDISRIVKKLDLKTGTIIEKCATVHQAISALLHSMTDHMGTKPSFYNKSQRNEDNKSVLLKSNDYQAKNNFRSTKQTEDNQLKPINETQIGKILQTGIVGPHHNKPYIYYPKPSKNVNLINNPDYKSLTSSGPRKFNSLNLQSSQNIKQAQTSTEQISSVHPSSIKPTTYSFISNSGQSQMILDQSTRLIRPIVTNQKPTTPTSSQLRNYQASNGNLTPTYSRSIKQASKFKQMLHQQDRSCNKLTGIRTDKSQKHFSKQNFYESQLIKSQVALKPHDKTQVGTARELTNQPKLNTNTKPNNQLEHPSVLSQWRHTPAPSTKTKQFYQMNSNMSPRFKTNHLPTTNCQQVVVEAVNLSQSTMYLKRPKVQPNAHFVPHPMHHGQKSPLKYKAEVEVSKIQRSQLSYKKEQNQPSIVLSDQQKCKMTAKAKQIKQLRQQMNILGIQVNSQAKDQSTVLEKDKSARDLLIKKKVQQKNRKHQDLKTAMSKLLQP